MKRLSLLACVIALGVTATAPAKADVDVILWKSGWCQIWDNAAGNKPWPPEEYVAVADGFATWVDALAALNTLVAERNCGW